MMVRILHRAYSHAMSLARLVVIVAATRAEQLEALAGVPEGPAVLVVPSQARAAELLGALRDAPRGPAAGPWGITVVPAERAVCCADRRVRLTPLEFALLGVLLQEQDRVWSMEELALAVWSTQWVGDGAAVRAVVKRLRRKLVQVEAPVQVENVRAAGFRLVRRDILV